MRNEFLSNFRILFLEFSSIEHPSVQIYGLRFWCIFGLSLCLHLSYCRAPEKKEGTVAFLWRSLSAAVSVTGAEGGEVGKLDIHLVEFGEYILNYVDPLQDPELVLQDMVYATHLGSEGSKEETTGSAAATDYYVTTTTTMQRYEKKIRSFVESGESLLGIWGMRGVGKSDLLELVHGCYYRNTTYHVIVVNAAACSGGLIVSRAQHAIAIALDFDTSSSSWDELGQIECRARVISNHLEERADEMRILLLLDDVEVPFNVFHLGLPISGSKIIYATRSQSVCSHMKKHFQEMTTIEMRCLGQDDAWDLFKQTVGLGIVDAHPQVHGLAKQIVEECRGLPMALRVIGRAMSSKSDVREWRNAHHLLKDKHSNTQQDEGYSCLDILQTQLNESFLVTSLWPRDGSIPKEMRIPAPKTRTRRSVLWIIFIYLLIFFCQLLLTDCFFGFIPWEYLYPET